MRLFAAVEPGDEVNSYLKNLQSDIKSDYSRLSLAKSFHLTLKFFGEVDRSGLPDILSRLGGIRFRKFELTTADIGFFPDSRRPRVVWIGINPHDSIMMLQDNIEKQLRKLGFPEGNRFHPHITLARIMRSDDMNLAGRVRQLRIERIRFSVDSFILFRSTLAPEGPLYEKILEIKADS